jgi:hypothetical protein
MSPGEQNMQTRHGALGTAQNGFGSAIQENRTRRPRYQPKLVRERKTLKIGSNAFGIVGNKSESAKNEK